MVGADYHALPEEKPSDAAVVTKLVQASVLCLVFMLMELVAGYVANSLALMTDAAHLLTDLSSFLISLFAIFVAKMPGTLKMSFGFHRAEILGAVVSVALIWVMTFYLLKEACVRLVNPQPVNGKIMFITALFGTLANLTMTFILKAPHSHGLGSMHTHDHSHDDSPACNHSHPHSHDVEADDTASTVVTEPGNLNLRAAYVHALGDLVQNVGVMIAAALVWWNDKWVIMDPLCTLLFSVLVLFTTLDIIKDAANVLMEGTPSGMDPREIHSTLMDITNVDHVHDLHVWSLSVGRPALACHILIDKDGDPREVLDQATKICQKKFGVLHTTIQIDFEREDSCDTDAHAKCF
ncbi:MAG: uncharacterized protein KVP18_000209 [Porospora cf. gigantea A]|uniref:uncharacterized protein n=1 Tax=Porospora cf. gigantea A TaxID=2853593 RepID=UPI00355AA63E|nr:MAG: hypothetical protein KVP18_000209 [Porospora cf. gigantea A]